MKKFLCKNILDTQKVAESFSQSLEKGDIVFLYGDLGAGKTTFVKAIAKEMGIEDSITSPTFTLLNIYGTKDLDFCHFDLYRLEDPTELEVLGFEEYFYSPRAICLVEWPQIIESTLDKKYKVVVIKKLDSDSREIIIGDSDENIIY